MINIAILGFGTIGSGVAEVLKTNFETVKSQAGDEVNVKYILDLRDFPDSEFGDRVVHDFKIILDDPEVSVVAEMMGGSHPAYDFSLAAIKAGKNVVTSNKEVVANFGVELLEAAKENKVRYLFEASVGGGIPIIRALTESLAGNEVCEINGILNGTTNYILTQMKERGITMQEALKEAQEKGYAEANPDADILGLDACRKICILSALAFGKLVSSDMVSTSGITEITTQDVEKAEANNQSIKLVARSVKLPDGKLCMSVSPVAVNNSNPLACVNDVFNAILVRGNTLGDVMFYGAGAGSLPTASAVVADIIDICRAAGSQPEQQQWIKSTNVTSSMPDDVRNDYIKRVGMPIHEAYITQ